MLKGAAMWWVIPFGLLLGLGAVATVSWSTEFLERLPRDVPSLVIPVLFTLGLAARPVIRAIGRRLVALPRHEPTRLDLNA